MGIECPKNLRYWEKCIHTEFEWKIVEIINRDFRFAAGASIVPGTTWVFPDDIRSFVNGEGGDGTGGGGAGGNGAGGGGGGGGDEGQLDINEVGCNKRLASPREYMILRARCSSQRTSDHSPPPVVLPLLFDCSWATPWRSWGASPSTGNSKL